MSLYYDFSNDIYESSNSNFLHNNLLYYHTYHSHIHIVYFVKLMNHFVDNIDIILNLTVLNLTFAFGIFIIFSNPS